MNLASEAEKTFEDPALVDPTTGKPYLWRCVVVPDASIRGFVGGVIFEILRQKEQAEADEKAGLPKKEGKSQAEMIAEYLQDGTRYNEIAGLRDRIAIASLLAVFDDGIWKKCKVVESRDQAVELVDGDFRQRTGPDGSIIVWLGWFSEDLLWSVFGAAIEKMTKTVRGTL